MSLYTSSSVDWVIEYVDENGVYHTVNAQGEQIAERVELTGKGKTLYFKVYPQKASVTSEAFLYGQNVNVAKCEPEYSRRFCCCRQTPALPETTPSAPVMPLLGVMALGIAVILLKKEH